MEKIKFNTSFAGTDKERRARHGLLWNHGDYRLLDNLFKRGEDLKAMCVALQRPADGVLSKLHALKYLSYDPVESCYYYAIEPDKTLVEFKTLAEFKTHSSQPQKKEPAMNKNLIESKVFVNGTDATDMSDAEIFRLIAKTEDEISKLKAIKTPSKKLSDAISKLEADVIKLAEYVDSRG